MRLVLLSEHSLRGVAHLRPVPHLEEGLKAVGAAVRRGDLEEIKHAAVLKDRKSMVGAKQ